MGRVIRTHTTRSADEIARMLASGGNYCCPMLPHYRYKPTQDAVRTLKRLGLIKKSGETSCGCNYVATDMLLTWRDLHKSGDVILGAVKWAKQISKSLGKD